MSEIVQDLAALEHFGRGQDGSFRRLAWSPELRSCLDWLAGRMRELGLATELDAAGNLIGRWGPDGGDALVIGSHLDTVESGGRFDGALGVLAGLEVVRRLRARDVRPSRPLWVVAVMDEEGVRFGEAMLGSRAFTGVRFGRGLGQRTDVSGTTLAEAMAAWDRRPEHLAEARAIDRVGAYLELHVEQGPILEEAGADLGVVTAIAGLSGLWIEVEGAANHAGTTPLRMRRDALAASAYVVAGLNEAARDSSFLATVGRFEVYGGGFNTVARQCRFSVDLRAPTSEALAAARSKLENLLSAARRLHRVDVGIRPVYALAPVPLDERLTLLLEQLAQAHGAKIERLPSGAGHDAMVVGRHVPAAMLFVPSRGGISHSPYEYSDPGAIELAVATLTAAAGRLLMDNPDA